VYRAGSPVYPGDAPMTREELEPLARAAAKAHGLDPVLVCAVVEQESTWRAGATRYEPAFYERYIAPMNLSPEEGGDRATSWGLMQVMGQVAVEFGFKGQCLDLLKPETGLEWGCKVLKHKMDMADGNLMHGLLRWNGGGRPAYADEVIAKMGKYHLPLPGTPTSVEEV